MALASKTYIINLDAYDLHPGDEKVFNHFMNDCHHFTYKYDRGLLLIKIYVYIYLYTYVIDYIWT